MRGCTSSFDISLKYVNEGIHLRKHDSLDANVEVLFCVTYCFISIHFIGPGQSHDQSTTAEIVLPNNLFIKSLVFLRRTGANRG